MRKRCILTGFLVLISIITAACGVSQEEYDRIVSERDEAREELREQTEKIELLEQRIEALETKPDVQDEEKQEEPQTLWDRKWAQQPSAAFTLQRVDDPEDYDVQGLRVNADFQVDIGAWYPDVEKDTFWVPAASLGTPDNTIEELLQLKGDPEKAKQTINVLFEALAFIHLIQPGIEYNTVIYGQDEIRWDFPTPAEISIRNNTINCAGATNIIHYLLEDDYDEVGYVLRHTSFESMPPGGHATSYIRQDDTWYFFDPVSLAEEYSHYPVEDGDGIFYEADASALVIRTTPDNYVTYLSRICKTDEAMFAMFSSSDGHFAFGQKETTLYYPLAFDQSLLTIWLDPEDTIAFREASYTPEPPENFSDFPPCSTYTQWTGSNQEGAPQVRSMQTDG